MANQLLARLGIVLAVDSAELVTGLNAAKEKFTGFTKEVQRQSNEAAKMTMALKYATDSYGKSLTAVERVELELKSGRLAGAMVSDIQLKNLREQAAAYDAVAAAAKKAEAAKGNKGLRPDLAAALGYQTTDVITGLAGGQNPFMVLLQQGGQLRDQFGGFKPMFEGIASVLSVARVAAVGFAGALAGIAYGIYKGHEEQKQFNNMLILTGGYLRMTETQFTGLSKTISDKYHVSLSDTRTALSQVAATGQFTATSLSSVGELIARMAKLTGESAATIATNLIPSLDGSASSAKRLNDQYHFLTVTQYEHIRQLAAQGKLQESIAYTSDLLTKSLTKQTRELGLLESAWEGVTGAVSGFWQSIKDVGKTPDLERQVESAWRAVGIALKRAESENATDLDKQMLSNARARYEKLALERGKKIAEDYDASIKADDNQKKIDDIASGRAAKNRQKRNQAEDFDLAARASAATAANDKISEIEQKRVKDMLTAIRNMRRTDEDEDFAHTTANAQVLAANLRAINAAAVKETSDIYAKAREQYRLAAQSESDAVEKESERIAFYKEHVFLQGSELKIAESRLKLEQEIAAIYAKKDGGSDADKAAAAAELRNIQKRREANILAEDELKKLQDMNAAVFNNMSSAIDTFVRTGKFSFKDFTRSVIQDLIAIAMKAQMLAMFKGFSFFGGASAAGTTGQFESDINTSGFSSVMASAVGGPLASGQPSIVGENGPELFVPQGAGTIVPNSGDLSGVMGGPQIVYNGPYIANMSAIDTQSATQFLARNKSAVFAANQSASRSIPASR